LSSSSSTEFTLPVLVGARDGLLTGEVSDDSMYVLFPSLELVAGEGCGDGPIEVVFSLARTHPSSSLSPVEALAQPWVTTFSFTTSEAQSVIV
jgi:hypothetical protein